MAFFTIAFLWIFGLLLITAPITVVFLFVVYRLTGGKRSFVAWCKAMGFIW